MSVGFQSFIKEIISFGVQFNISQSRPNVSTVIPLLQIPFKLFLSVDLLYYNFDYLYDYLEKSPPRTLSSRGCLIARGGFGLRSATVGAKQTSTGRLAPLDTTAQCLVFQNLLQIVKKEAPEWELLFLVERGGFEPISH